MTLQIKRATKTQLKLKMCLSGGPGAGKTYTALTFAQELANGGRILVLDTEKGSASLYSDEFEFDTIQLWARDERRRPIKDPFHPEKYMEAIRLAEEGGYAVLVIDSLSHCWNDEGGFLSLNRRIAAQKYHNNTASAWLDTDPLYRQFINAITDARVHIIATVRSKTEIDISKDESGKAKVSKLGTKVVQRDELEFEFTVYGRMEADNTLIIEKSRCRAISGAMVHAPTGDFLAPVKAWLSSGAPVEAAPAPVEEEDELLLTEQQKMSILKLCERLGKSEPENLASLTFAQAKALIATLTQEYRERKTGAGAPSPAQAQDAPASREEVLYVFNRGVKAGWCKNTAESFAEKAGDVLERPILAASVATSFRPDELHMLELAIAAYAAQKEREQAAEVK